MTQYHGIMMRMPAALRTIVHEYADPETTYIYTRVQEMNAKLTEQRVDYRSNPVQLLAWSGPVLAMHLRDTKLFDRLTTLMDCIATCYEHAKPKSSLRVSEEGKHYLEYIVEKFGIWHKKSWIPFKGARYHFYMDRVEFVFAMILCGFEYDVHTSLTEFGSKKMLFLAKPVKSIYNRYWGVESNSTSKSKESPYDWLNTVDTSRDGERCSAEEWYQRKRNDDECLHR